MRGGGDLATGAVWRLHRAGFPIVVTELAAPLTIRRTVAVSAAVDADAVEVEGMRAERAADPRSALALAADGVIAVVVDPGLPPVAPAIVVDARMAKRNLGSSRSDAGLVVALGPGFEAGIDVHAVVETKRGHHLGRVLWRGSAAEDTGTPGVVGGKTRDRVVWADRDGEVRWVRSIGDHVTEGEVIGTVAGVEVASPSTGVVRGLIADGHTATRGLKIADVDPRGDETAAYEISDKALAVGGGVLEAVMTWLNR